MCFSQRAPLIHYLRTPLTEHGTITFSNMVAVMYYPTCSPSDMTLTFLFERYGLCPLALQTDRLLRLFKAQLCPLADVGVKMPH